MKSVPLFGVVTALVLSAAPSQAETISTVADLATDNSIPAPLLAALLLVALALVGTKIARRRLNRLNWDLHD